MTSALRKAEIASALGSRFVSAFQVRERTELATVSTGVPELDAATGGLPRGAITEIFGAASSGRTSLLLTVLAAATHRQEACALVDTTDAFDPASAADAGVRLDQLLWVRCGSSLPRAIQVTDLLLQGGGFGLVALDLGDAPQELARRIPLTSWFRFRRGIEDTPTALIVIEQQPHAKSCATLMLEMTRQGVIWSGYGDCSRLLRGFALRAERRKPSRAAGASFQCETADARR